MSVVFPDRGRKKISEIAFKDSYLESGFQLRLFVNDKTPASSDTLASYTEMSTLGYAEKEIARTAITVTLTGGVVSVKIPKSAFVFTGGTPVTVYGWYLTVFNIETYEIVCSERFSSPISVSQNGDTINVDPTLYASQGS